MRVSSVGVAVISWLFLFANPSAWAQNTTGWQLVWSDEFNGPANTLPGAANWNYDLGGGGWGNGEQETYTNSLSNIFQDGNGNLVIRALKDASGNYTSARIRTGRLGPGDPIGLAWQYGKIEARIKLPFGQGVWPAFWMLGADYPNVFWPACGEIDILENFGGNIDNASTVHGTLHGPPAGSNYAGTGVGSSYVLPFGEKLNDDYHVFAIEWSRDSIQLEVDGAAYQTLTPASIPVGGQWVFNQPFFIILNLAIGGPTTFLGAPAANTVFPQSMLVDYVRVYQATALPAATPGIIPGGIVNAASGLGTVTPGALASVYGSNLSDAIYTPSDLFQSGTFSTSTPSAVSVAVNGIKAPLIYVSPAQINFQIPWETALAPSQINVTVNRNGVSSSPEAITVSPASPSAFLDSQTGEALVTQCSGNVIQAGSACVIWGNGFGPKSVPPRDGAPADPAATVNPCVLTIGGQAATVTYCGAAPDEIIDQLNFVYPPGVPVSSSPVSATLTINGVTGVFQVPGPAH